MDLLSGDRDGVLEGADTFHRASRGKSATMVSKAPPPEVLLGDHHGVLLYSGSDTHHAIGPPSEKSTMMVSQARPPELLFGDHGVLLYSGSDTPRSPRKTVIVLPCRGSPPFACLDLKKNSEAARRLSGFGSALQRRSHKLSPLSPGRGKLVVSNEVVATRPVPFWRRVRRLSTWRRRRRSIFLVRSRSGPQEASTWRDSGSPVEVPHPVPPWAQRLLSQ